MCALMRPDIFKSYLPLVVPNISPFPPKTKAEILKNSVIIMSHPFKGSPALPFAITSPNYNPPPSKPDIHSDLAELPEPRKHYKWYYSTAPAASEMDNPKGDALHTFLRGYFHLKSADWQENNPQPLHSWSAPELAKLPYYYVMPLHSSMREAVSLDMRNENKELVQEKSSRWLPDSDLAIFVREWSRTGFQGGLNWYRVATAEGGMRDVEVFAGKKIEVPMLFVSGRKDWGMYQEPGVVEKMAETCKKGCFKGVQIVEGAGHWVQQEQPERVVEIVSKFLWDNKVEEFSM